MYNQLKLTDDFINFMATKGFTIETRRESPFERASITLNIYTNMFATEPEGHEPLVGHRILYHNDYMLHHHYDMGLYRLGDGLEQDEDGFYTSYDIKDGFHMTTAVMQHRDECFTYMVVKSLLTPVDHNYEPEEYYDQVQYYMNDFSLQEVSTLAKALSTQHKAFDTACRQYLNKIKEQNPAWLSEYCDYEALHGKKPPTEEEIRAELYEGLRKLNEEPLFLNQVEDII
jgi:hypothetical protein